MLSVYVAWGSQHNSNKFCDCDARLKLKWTLATVHQPSITVFTNISLWNWPSSILTALLVPFNFSGRNNKELEEYVLDACDSISSSFQRTEKNKYRKCDILNVWRRKISRLNDASAVHSILNKRMCKCIFKTWLVFQYGSQ